MHSSLFEKRNDYLSAVIPVMHQSLLADQYPAQGRLFAAGALMEFKQKGLVQVLATPKELPVKKVVKGLNWMLLPKKERW